MIGLIDASLNVILPSVAPISASHSSDSSTVVDDHLSSARPLGWLTSLVPCHKTWRLHLNLAQYMIAQLQRLIASDAFYPWSEILPGYSNRKWMAALY